MPLPCFPDPVLLRRGARFLAVGGGSALVQLAVLALLEGRMGASAAFSVSWVVSTAVHYLANRFWALPSPRRDTGRQLGEYLGVVALSYGVNLAAFEALRTWLGLGALWAACGAIPPSTLVVWVLLHHRVFRAR